MRTSNLYGRAQGKSNLPSCLHRLFLLLVLIVPAGCVGFGFWFEQLDELAVWQMDRMLDLDSAQEEALEPQAEAFREWLRSEGVPEAQALLADVGSLWENGKLIEATDRMEAGSLLLAEHLMAALWQHMKPVMPLLREENFAHWQQYSRDRYPDWFDEAISLEAKREDRIHRLEEWFGDLSDDQLKLAGQYLSWSPDEYNLRVSNSDQWRNRLAEMILSRDWETLQPLWLDPVRMQSPAYQAWREQERTDYRKTLLVLYATLTDSQRRHARARLQDWQDKLGEIEPADAAIPSGLP